VTCRELADFIGDYLSGELPEATRTTFERHLSLCPNCRTYMASYEATSALGRRAFENDAPVPPDVPKGLIAAILSARDR
jgi:anti-sigma factor RsiW